MFSSGAMSGQGEESGSGWFKQGLHIGLLFATLAAAFSSYGPGGGVLSCAAKPCGENRLRAERSRLARQNDESGLSHFFRQSGVTKLVQGDRINQVDMP